MGPDVSRRRFIACLTTAFARPFSVGPAENMIPAISETNPFVPALIAALGSVANPIRYSVFDIEGRDDYVQDHSALCESQNILMRLADSLKQPHDRENILLRSHGEFARIVLACSQISDQEVRGIKCLRDVINNHEPGALEKLSATSIDCLRSASKGNRSLFPLAAAVDSLQGNSEAEIIVRDFNRIVLKGRRNFEEPLNMLVKKVLNVVGFFNGRHHECLTSVEAHLALCDARSPFITSIASALRSMRDFEDLQELAKNPLLITQSRYYMALDDLSTEVACGWGDSTGIREKLEKFRTTKREMINRGIEEDRELESIIDSELEAVGLRLEPAYLSIISIETQLSIRSAEGEIAICGQLGKNGRLYFPLISSNGHVDLMDDLMIERLRLFFTQNRPTLTKTFTELNCTIPKDSSVDDVRMRLSAGRLLSASRFLTD